MNGACKGVDSQNGTCVPLKRCNKLYDISKKKPIPEDQLYIIRQSFCGSYENKIYVCCLPETLEDATKEQPSRHRIDTPLNDDSNPVPEAPVWLKSLQEKLKDVSCPDLEDFVFGGEKTKIDDYPWMALLEYLKS